LSLAILVRCVERVGDLNAAREMRRQDLDGNVRFRHLSVALQASPIPPAPSGDTISRMPSVVPGETAMK
jgi:hypothetical protein